MEKSKKINYIFIFSMLLWVIITLARVCLHTPWYDEAHAWQIAKDLNLVEIFKLMPIEGHTCIWYLLLMPFAKLNFGYPISMLIMNWFFCFVSLLIMWTKAPFNNFIKVLISFTFPFLALYSVVARCYSIGIMFLFMLVAMEKEKLKYPKTYSLVLVLCANTSIMAIVGATVFGMFFIKDLIKNNVAKIGSFLILLLGALFVLIQLPFSLKDNPQFLTNNIQLDMNFFNSTFFQNFLNLNLLVLVISVLLILFFYIKNKIIPYFLILTYLLLFIIAYKYVGAMWHHFFFYIFFIISCWLLMSEDEFEDYKFKPIISSILIIVSLLFVFWRPEVKDIKNIWKCDIDNIAKNILNDSNLKGSNIYVFDVQLSPIDIYLYKKNIKVVNYCAKSLTDVLSYYFSDYCRFDGTDNSIILLSDKHISESYKDNSYFLTKIKVKNLEQGAKISLKNYDVKKYKEIGNKYILWKLERKK